MANNSADFHEWICLFSGIVGVSNFKIKTMNIQEILVYVVLVIAVAFLYKKFFGKKKPKKDCGDDCGCH